MSLADLKDLCEEIGVTVVEYPLEEACGYALWVEGTPYVYIAEHLTGPEKVITGYHELAHILYHPSHPEVFERTGNLWNMNKCNRQAEIVGVVAWMPEIRRLTVEEISEEFEVSIKLAQFRHELGY